MLKTNNRELSWLAFNDRVLQEACDPPVPLLQRLRFLGIFSSNQDEFVKVRLAGLVRMSKSKARSGRKLSGGFLPEELLPLVNEKIRKNQAIFDRTYDAILAEMAEAGIRVIDETMLDETQRDFVLDYFASVVSVRLVPLMVNKTQPLPFLSDDHIYHAVKMTRKGRDTYAITRIPVSRDCPRFIQLPSPAPRHDIIYLDDVIRFCLDDIFFMFKYDSISAHAFRIVRDAQLTLEDDISISIVEKMEKGLENREHGLPVRLAHDADMPADLLALLARKLNLGEEQTFAGGRYHMMRDLMKFPKVRRELEETAIAPLPHPDIVPFSSILKVIRKKDVLVNFPYHTFNHLVDFLREAAIDPKVENIFITLYRTAERSKVINALVNAARNGKNVVALVELMARFDEEKNISDVDTLQEAGVRVIHGLPDLKVHSKLVLVERREAGRARGYAYVGTGNFNEDTATLYSDFGLFTADQDIVDDARDVFGFLMTGHRQFEPKKLLVAPFSMRKKLTRLIEREIKNAKAGLPAYIHAKCNTLTDKRMVRLLYEAGQAGVEVRLIVRGACCLMPQVKGLSENIRAISIVDKFLEHSRLYIFAGGGQEKIYIASADWMTRNLDKRLEVGAPITAENVRQTLRDFFDIQWSDNDKARNLAEMGVNTYVPGDGAPPVRSQTALYQYYRGKK